MNERFSREKVYLAMISLFAGDPRRIQHFTKVHSYAALIGKMEQLPETEQGILELAALVHDIGIKPGEEKFGRSDGKIQEQEGPAVARELLTKEGISEDITERICYLVGHHHTYDGIDGADYQILVEADFLVNLYEETASEHAIRQAKERIFKTKSGIRLLEEIFKIA